MKIHVASHSGFCFGVKKAVETALLAAKDFEGRKIYTYGPIIHNHQVTKYMEENGVQIIEDLEQVPGEIVIVRSHGVPRNIYDKAASLRIQLIDTTCPYVRKVQQLARKYHGEGYKVVIMGDSNHPEVIGINGWADFSARIEADSDHLEDLKDAPKLCFVAQTTLSIALWKRLEDAVKDFTGEVVLYNTICAATEERQKECGELSAKVDLMIVIGGKHSSNTQKLYQIAKKGCSSVIHIEEASELLMNLNQKYDNIGITAGASTPDWIIKEVIEQLKTEGEVIVNDER